MIIRMLAAASVLFVAACEGDFDVEESSAAPDLVSRSDMPAYCRGEASAAFGDSPNEYVALPSEPSATGFTVPVQYPAGTPTQFFDCTFTSEGEFVAITAT